MTNLTAEQQERLAQVTHLAKGLGTNGAKDACAMQAVDWIDRGGNHFTAQPPCTSRIIGTYVTTLNDAMTDQERDTYLLPELVHILGTATDDSALELRWALKLVDYAVRVFTPPALERSGFPKHAETLRALPEIVDRETAKAAAEAAYTTNSGVATHAATAAYAVHNTYTSAITYVAMAAAARRAWPEAINALREVCALR